MNTKTFNPFDENFPDLSLSFHSDGSLPRQIENLLHRLSEYRRLHRDLKACLDEVSSEHYRVFTFDQLNEIKEPLRAFLYAREGLFKLEESLNKEITLFEKILKRVRSKETRRSGKHTKSQRKTV